MATYTVESDKVFLRSLGDGVVEVNEIENLNISLIQDRHWTVRPTITLGRCKEYEVLLIGDTEIKGRDLRTFLEDLCDSRLMVNSEGLCILPITGIVNEEFEVGYYRIFDLFEWSKYGVKSTLKTRWNRSDLLSGRYTSSATTITPSLDDVFVCVKYPKVQSVEMVMLEECKLKLESSARPNVVEFQKEFNIRKSELEPSTFYLDRLQQWYIISSPMNVKIDETVTGSRKWNTYMVPTIVVANDMFITKAAVALLAPELRVSSFADADANNWRAVAVYGSYMSGLQGLRFNGVFVYYDGSIGHHKFEQLERMPVPVRDGVPFHLTNGITFFIRGLGPRYGCFFADA